MSQAVLEHPAPASPSAPTGRVAGLDGLRGLCALYVLLFHCWAYTFKGFPKSTGPAWLDWLGLGRLAVVFFLVLSGFSLAVGPARNGWRLGGLGRFARRRAWRILPAYWAALAFSLVITLTVVRMPHSGPPNGKSVVVFGLLLQDLVRAPTPNGAFWSISVEALLYLTFPALLLIIRRAGVTAMLFTATIPVVLAGLIFAPAGAAARYLTWQLLPVFAAGVAAAAILPASSTVRRAAWPAMTMAVALPVAALIVLEGGGWVVAHYFWVDLAVTPALALLVVTLATGRPAPLVRLLSSRPLARLGSFSYSLYLIHLPIVVAFSLTVVAPRLGHGLAAFAVTTAVTGSVSLVTAWLFAKLFEFPFQRRRSITALLKRTPLSTSGPSGQS
ncbi:acyltransferase family protein [Actinoplanes sp. NPDC049265]|uniref:acyltransferase family protein n=1 Tax=Actinoplanes sp. NPDC049265 TaxID=3363902 RepID=UPI00371FAC4C